MDDLWISSSSGGREDGLDNLLAMMGSGVTSSGSKRSSSSSLVVGESPKAPKEVSTTNHAQQSKANPFSVVKKVASKRQADDPASSSSHVRVSKVSFVSSSSSKSTSKPGEDKDEEERPTPTLSAQMPTAPDSVVPVPQKEKHKTLTLVEDPMQYHAKPKDLSQQNALKRPRELVKSDASVKGDGGGGDKTTHTFARTTFGNLPLHSKIVEHLELSTDNGGFGLSRSTGVQSAVIPLQSKARQNVLIKSQTGSGKTLGYLLPIISDLASMQPAVQRGDGTRAVVIAPTRELCSQIADVLDRLTQCCVNIVGGSITGGEKKKSEKARLRKGIVVLVGTPGRLLDHLKTTESFRLSMLRWVVLDEADRLLDMGFEQSILEILSLVRGERLSGLKAPSQREQEAAARVAAGSLQQRWSHQSSRNAKICNASHEIVHLMASATLTWGVRLLAGPVMGGASFAVVDADKETVVNVDSAEELLKEKNSTASSLSSAPAENRPTVKTNSGIVSFVNEDGDGDDDNYGVGAGAGDDNDSENGRAGKIRRTDKPASTSLLKGEVMDAPQQLSQYYMTVTCKWRLAALVCFLKAHAHQKVVVFFTTCDSVDFHALLLREAGWPFELDPGVEHSSGDDVEAETADSAAANAKMKQTLDPLSSHFTGMFGSNCSLYRLHGSVPQAGRQTVFHEFSAAKRGVLLCTDVAARGLDLPHVDWILQYDPPCETADYVHRVGRTARRGLGGSALLFLLPSEANYIQLLASHHLNPEPLSLQALFQDTAQHISGAAKFKNTDEMTAVILQRRLESVVHGNRPLLGAARQTFRSFVRAYATHSSETKGIFSVQALHLGHVAKSFALRESPKALRAADDMMAKINNGHFSVQAGAAKTGKMTRQARDEKYALSANAGKNAKQNKKKDKQKVRKMGSSSTSSSSNSSSMGPSGKFRKAGSGGYFKKRLREQTNAEFAS